MRVRESPEQSYKGLWGTSVSSLGKTEAIYHPGSVNFQSTGSALPFPLSLSGHELLMEMNGMFILLLSLMSISLSLDVFFRAGCPVLVLGQRHMLLLSFFLLGTR